MLNTPPSQQQSTPTTPATKLSPAVNNDYWFDHDEDPPSPPTETSISSPDESETSSHSVSTVNKRLLDDLDIDSLSTDWCHCCFLKYTSDSEKKKHLEGREHLKRLEIKDKLKNNLLEANNFCKYCYSKIQDEVQKNAHLKSPAHQLQIKRHIDYLKYIKNHELASKSSSRNNQAFKSSKTYTNMFALSQTVNTASKSLSLDAHFEQLDVFIDIFHIADITRYKYVDTRTQSHSAVKSMQVKCIEDTLDEDQRDKREWELMSELTTAPRLKLDDVLNTTDTRQIKRFLRANFDLFGKSLSVAFDSMTRATFAGNN